MKLRAFLNKHIEQTGSELAKDILEKEKDWSKMFTVFGGIANVTESDIDTAKAKVAPTISAGESIGKSTSLKVFVEDAPSNLADSLNSGLMLLSTGSTLLITNGYAISECARTSIIHDPRRSIG